MFSAKPLQRDTMSRVTIASLGGDEPGSVVAPKLGVLGIDRGHPLEQRDGTVTHPQRVARITATNSIESPYFATVDSLGRVAVPA